MSRVSRIHSLFVLAGLDIFDKKDTPSWLKEHPEIKKRNEIKKVFPAFGLKNFKDKVKYQTKDTSERERVVLKMLDDLRGQIYDIYREFIILDDRSDSPENLDVVRDLQFFRHASNALFTAETVEEAGKVKIVFEEPVSLNGRQIFRKGEGIFSAFNKINTILDKFSMKYPKLIANNPKTSLPSIDSIPSVKQFHKINVPNKEYYVVFSAGGDEGAWDICTMSMRGIRSCQSWEAPYEDLSPYNRSLVGSVLSKYVGIIYLTSGNETGHDYEKYGTRMIKRCLVRFVINTKKDNEKLIVLDQMYDSYDPVVAQMFIDALQKRTPLKVLNYSAKELTEDLPMATDLKVPGERTLQKLSPDEQPYKDLPFYAIQPPGLGDQWWKSVTETTRHLKFAAQDIYEGTLNKFDYDMVERLTDMLTGRTQKATNIVKAVTYGLDTYLRELIEKTDRMRVQADLRIKYIRTKMEQFFVLISRATLKEMCDILAIDMPAEAEHTPGKIRDSMDDVLFEYRMLFYKEFK